MDIQEYKWRDRIVLFFCWIVPLFSALTNWAVKTSSQAYGGDSNTRNWWQLEPTVYTILLLIVFLLPLVLYALVKRGHFLSSSRTLRRFQQPRTFWLLVFSFNCVLLTLLLEELRRSYIVEFVLIGHIALVVIWLFYRRTDIDIGKIISAATIWAAIITISRTLLLMPGKIDFLTASWFTKGYILLHVLIMFILVLLSLFLFINPQLETKLRRLMLSGVPIWLFGVVFIIVASSTVLIPWIGGRSFKLELVYRLSLLFSILMFGPLLLWVNLKETGSNSKGIPRITNLWYIALLCLLFAVYGMLAIYIGINHLEHLNPDGLSYLIIARNYAEGNPVVRGYWSPLLSWLIAPFIAQGVNPHIGYWIITAFAGFVWILISNCLVKRYRIHKVVRIAIVASLIVIALEYGLRVTAPDLLGAMFVVLYFYWITHPDFYRRPVRYGVLAGMSGALAYYGKYYNLAFVLASLFLTAILFVIHGKRSRSMIVGILVSVVILFLSVTPWVIALYSRYGELSISTSGAIAHAVVGPNANSHPCWENQLCDQPTDVLIPWEDPQSQDYTAFGWSPFDSLDNFRHQIRVVKSNILIWFSTMMTELGPLVPMTLLASSVAILSFWTDMNRRFHYSWALLTFLLYISGYMFTFASTFRYYLAVIPIILVAGYSLLQLLFDKVRKIVAGAIGVAMFNAIIAAGLFLSILSLGKLDYVEYSLQTRYDPCIKRDSETLGEYLESPIAGSHSFINHIAYYTQKRTLGVLSPDMEGDEADRLLHDMGVKTYVIGNEEDLAYQLQVRFNYLVVLKTMICGSEYLFLRVSE